MAGESGTETRALEALTRRLMAEPYGFDFFVAVRRLENLCRDKARVGHSKRPVEDALRFCQEASLAFAPSTVRAYRYEVGARAPRMYISFLGLLGPNGPMPLHLTQYVRNREVVHHDHAMARFVDLYHHRLVSFFYRAWAANQQTVQYERGEDDRFAMYFASLFGMGMASYRHRDAVPDVAKLHYSGHLVCQTRHPEGICSILADYYGIAVSLQEFIGQWMDIPPDCICRLGESPETGTLGMTALVGSRMWEAQRKFRLRFGPMGFEEYRRMLPGGDSLRRLLAWMKMYLNDELRWDVQLVLKKEEVPPLKMGAGGVGQLGWTTWLTSEPLDHDADDLILQPQQAVGL